MKILDTVLLRLVVLIALLLVPGLSVAQEATEPSATQSVVRNDLQISGVYPHLTVYGIYSQNGGHFLSGHDECGIGAIVPWAGKLWMVNYAPHKPNGSEHKLYSIDEDLQTLTVHPESVGGTPAGRMIHKESNQLLIAHYLIDSDGKVRVISPRDMPMRVTAITRHLTDPANMVYYVDMEGSIWEANVHTLEAKMLFKKPVPGWHGKGATMSQGRLVISNNGELPAGTYKDLLVGGASQNDEEAGVLAEWDGETWRVVERRQYTDVTSPAGIAGGSDGDDPIWAIGWDRRSLRLKLLEDGRWSTYLLPKAALCNDARHGWYTEWPRIREITGGRWMMDMHGMFYDFPKTFSRENSAGIAPIASHLRYIPDFCAWNDRLVLATDETSIQGNELAGQPQTNLWFGQYEDLKTWGPASGYGGPWIDDKVKANTPSDPFLVAGFDRRVIHLAAGRKRPYKAPLGLRASDQLPITNMSEALIGLPRVTVNRGSWHRAAAGFHFTVDKPVTVYLAVDRRGDPELDAAWKATDMQLDWSGYRDTVYERQFPAGKVTIPGNATEHKPGSFGMPHMALIRGDADLKIVPSNDARLTAFDAPDSDDLDGVSEQPLRFTIQVDAEGNGKWSDLEDVTVPGNGYVSHHLPEDLQAVWLRVKTDRDCVATAFLHQTSAGREPNASQADKALFAGLAEVGQAADGALLYPAKRNRNLRVITQDDRFFDFTKAEFAFEPTEVDEKLAELLAIEPEFHVDDASVVLTHNGRKLRLPKGDAAFDAPFASGWPRGTREVESERHLANYHGTFYEIPLLFNGSPPIFELMRPVSSHSKQISDFCTWNGLLVLAGARSDAEPDGHVFRDPSQNVGLWFGAVDDLWKLGKPVGHGGPWKSTAVSANAPSDPYLMTGYDRKTLTLEADADTQVTIEVDVDHQSGWHIYKTVDLKANQPLEFEFPEDFSAHWVRFRSSQGCTATAQLEYR
ncbi:hypothetical protein [Rosistilla oblonga]|uniref:hypothetical protein n=1 Tax=Rosistilla oblonga TaxID=2527990 RepID=UPI003A9734B8